MAAEVSSLPNGSHASHQGYNGDANGYSYANNSSTQQPSTQSTPQQTAQQADISKDEVGWYFVEQYYTTLSRNPEKIHLFYNKRSQFVSGQETDKVPVCVGQRAINDKIKELDFHDCKVRVTNVDSQSSDSNIVIQVIGEISNRSQPHKKFTQTFVLATQTNGYFVLNDIFRYLVDEEDEQEPETAGPSEAAKTETSGAHAEPSKTVTEPATLTSSSDATAVERDAKVVDKKLEDNLADQVVSPAGANGTSEATSKIEDSTPAVAQSEAKPAEEVNAAAATAEKPKTPEPTRAASPVKQQASQPPAASKPALPKTWANLAASAVATPAIPTAQRAAAPAPAPATTAKSNKPAVPTPAAAAASNAAPSTATPSAPSAPTPTSAPRQDAEAPAESQDEWTAVGGSHHRQQSRQVNAAQPEGQTLRGYVKNVGAEVSQDELKAALEKFGELSYLDISRSKNCAFVDYKNVENLHKALGQHVEIRGDRLFVEERRFQPNRGNFQGGRGGNRGGANGGPQRGNFQGNRGNNAGGRGRGGNAAGQNRGRGQA